MSPKTLYDKIWDAHQDECTAPIAHEADQMAPACCISTAIWCTK